MVAHTFVPQLLDAGSQFIFGESTETMLPGGSDLGRQFKRSLDYAQDGLTKMTMMGPSALFHKDPKIQEACNTLHAFVDICIERAAKIQEKRKRDGIASNQHVLAYDLLDQIDGRIALRFELLHVFFAATDTSSSLLTNTLFLLARHPDAWARLREEVRGFQSEELTFETVKGIGYLQ
jgi:cytochrome P450